MKQAQKMQSKMEKKQDELKERFFQAYFLEGKNIDQQDILLQNAVAVGLDKSESKAVLESAYFESEIEQDLYESRLIGVKGVPFFVFDRHYGIAGAEPDEVFDRTLQQALQKINSGQT